MPQEQYSSELQQFTGRDTAAGPASVLFAGVHGNETPGIEAGKLLIPFMGAHLENGTVTFAWGNPEAIAKNVRFIDTNLNRMFLPADELSEKERQSYEYRRAQELKVPLLEEAPATALLDMHGTGNRRSRAHVICGENGLDLAAKLPLDTVVLGFDTYEPGGTDYYANTQGKKGICVEAGYSQDPESIKKAYDAALAFFVAQGHTSGQAIERFQTQWRLFYVRKTLEHYVPEQPTRPDFSEVLPGDLLGHDGEEEVRVPDLLEEGEKAIILFGASERQPGVEAFLLAKAEATN